MLPRFGPEDAWTLGSLIVERARATGAGVLVDVRRGDFVLFRAVLPGATIDQQHWAVRKAAVVQRFEASSALVAARMERHGVDPVAVGWLDHGYAVTGGSFPVRVAGAGVVAAVTASGLSSAEDHDLVVHGLQRLLATME
ncbi:heme-binding protein [Kineococcus sp. SYSU DK003]|uniref:heme-binding protein n=1 Tax=Kineococcus sp. SYSU DK003 TaxID=3383124 RepID=UPI003D7D2204